MQPGKKVGMDQIYILVIFRVYMGVIMLRTIGMNPRLNDVVTVFFIHFYTCLIFAT